MKRIRIPEEYVDAILEIGTLDDDAIDELITALSAQAPALYDGGLPERVANSLTLVNSDMAEDMVEAIVSMYPNSYMGTGYSLDIFVDGIISDLSKMEEAENATSILLERLKINLIRLLDVKSIGIAAKGTGLALENAASYMSSQIMTDVRPVFCDEGDRIDAAIIVQTLSINYIESPGGRKQFSVALDSVDIRSLINILERAERKALSIKRNMLMSSTLILEPNSLEADE